MVNMQFSAVPNVYQTNQQRTSILWILTCDRKKKAFFPNFNLLLHVLVNFPAGGLLPRGVPTLQCLISSVSVDSIKVRYYQTRERVFHHDIQTLRSGLKKQGTAKVFN